MGLMEEIGPGPVGLDTAIFIYFIEEHEHYLAYVARLFEAMDRGQLLGVTSTITLLETLVVPYRSGNSKLASEYEELLANGRGLELIELDRDQLRAAAHLRAVANIRTPDALQVVAAMSRGAEVFVTNDRRLPELPGFRSLQLRDYCQ